MTALAAIGRGLLWIGVAASWPWLGWRDLLLVVVVLIAQLGVSSARHRRVMSGALAGFLLVQPLLDRSFLTGGGLHLAAQLVGSLGALMLLGAAGGGGGARIAVGGHRRLVGTTVATVAIGVVATVGIAATGYGPEPLDAARAAVGLVLAGGTAVVAYAVHVDAAPGGRRPAALPVLATAGAALIASGFGLARVVEFQRVVQQLPAPDEAATLDLDRAREAIPLGEALGFERYVRRLRLYLGDRLARAEGDPLEAARHLDAVLRVDPTSFPANVRRAELFLDAGDYPRAMTRFLSAAGDPAAERWVVSFPFLRDDSYAYTGRHLLQRGRPAAAVLVLRRGLGVVPDSISLREILAEAYLEQGDPSAAAAVLRDLLERYPARAEAAYLLGFALWRAGEPRQALQRTDAAAGPLPDDARTLAWMVDAAAHAPGSRSGAAARARLSEGTVIHDGPWTRPEQHGGVLDSRKAVLELPLFLPPGAACVVELEVRGHPAAGVDARMRVRLDGVVVHEGFAAPSWARYPIPVRGDELDNELAIQFTNDFYVAADERRRLEIGAVFLRCPGPSSSSDARLETTAER